ncbi:hypothetical protein NX786_16320 [Telluria mixta]|uniref:Lipoprotein n=1 Tax=Telluria mixta TaxID=34071 RepID=A0ABT2C0J1_9BURK|nr:hypothetical protein [Telluria mixta]MCS0630898.1 hypothetical protein [Telluria mixta]WEM98899.1 hypothetical protein P0M04_14695 [Telluria mixta]
MWHNLWHTRLSLLPVLAFLSACSTPYRPPVVVHDSATFPGIASIVAEARARPVDVLLVHGMCTHDTGWAERQIDRITGIVEDHAPTPASATTPPRVEVVERTRRLAGGTVRFHALVWSPLTAGLKHQLDVDMTGTPTDCTAAGVCKPKRARLNGYVKDRLLNDCLSDAVIYQGESHVAIRDAMVRTIAQVLEQDPDSEAPLVVVAESLGSKMLFDALSAMLESWQPQTRALGQQAARRLGLLFMAGNQLPILGLAEQRAIATQNMRVGDALQRFLDLRRRQPNRRAETLQRLAVVAFTDPNDLLSYRLLPARYTAPDVAVADVLVSNDSTWLGLIENPVTAHLDYLANPDVGTMIACGYPSVASCR